MSGIIDNSVTVKINHGNVLKVIELMKTENLRFDINDWLYVAREFGGVERYSLAYDTQNHCGTTGCVLGHMHVAGMVEMESSHSSDNFKLLGKYFINPGEDHIFKNCPDVTTVGLRVGEYIGSGPRYGADESVEAGGRITVTVHMVIARLEKLLNHTHLVCYTNKIDIDFINPVLNDNKLGLSFRNQL